MKRKLKETKIEWDDLGFLTSRELWGFLAKLKIPYCNIEDEEKENLVTGEKVIVPKFIPRTDYDGMKSDILMGLRQCNRETRRSLEKEITSIIKKSRIEYGKMN